MCRSRSSSNSSNSNSSRSNSIEIDILCSSTNDYISNDAVGRVRTDSYISIGSCDSIYIEDAVNIIKRNKYPSVAIVINNGHKTRKRDVYMDDIYHDPSPTPTNFLEKIINHDIWSSSKSKK